MAAPFDPVIFDSLVFDTGDNSSDDTDARLATARFWEPPLKHRKQRVARK